MLMGDFDHERPFAVSVGTAVSYPIDANAKPSGVQQTRSAERPSAPQASGLTALLGVTILCNNVCYNSS